MEKFKLEAVSFVHTFLGTLGAELLTALSLIPAEQIFTVDFWSSAGIGAVFVSAIRSAVKLTWQRVFTPKFGGLRKPKN